VPPVRGRRVRPGPLTGVEAIPLSSFTDYFKFLSPLHDLWLAVVYTPLDIALAYLYAHIQTIAAVGAIGAYGVAIILLTIGIKALLSPLTQFQLTTQRKTMVEQRKLAPQVADLRKKYRKDVQKMNAEVMKLYQEHGVNPLGGAIGCLPLIIQIPILSGLYFVFSGFARTHHLIDAHFLFIPNLNENPNHHLLFPGVPIPIPVYFVFPLLAALTTFVQSKMLQMPPVPNPTEQELQAQQMQRTMVLISPLMFGYFALNVPAGLGLYWFVSNCVGIIQQYFVVGWGQLWPSRAKPLPGMAPPAPTKALPGKAPPPKAQGPSQKNGPAPGGTNNFNNKSKKAKNRTRSDLN